jgi:hypothetical protein
MQPVRKAVIPAAGLGTRFLPARPNCAIPASVRTIAKKRVDARIVRETCANSKHVFAALSRRYGNFTRGASGGGGAPCLADFARHGLLPQLCGPSGKPCSDGSFLGKVMDCAGA